MDINIFESNSLNRKVRADKVGLLALPQRSLTLEAKHIMAASTFRCVKSIGSGSSPAINIVKRGKYIDRGNTRSGTGCFFIWLFLHTLNSINFQFEAKQAKGLYAAEKF